MVFPPERLCSWFGIRCLEIACLQSSRSPLGSRLVCLTCCSSSSADFSVFLQMVISGTELSQALSHIQQLMEVLTPMSSVLRCLVVASL